MKCSAILLTLILATLSLFAGNAEAKRFGGGGSIGKQRSMSAPAQKAPAIPYQAAPQPTTPPAAAAQGNKWIGPLAGLAAGIGLAALFSHLGIGEGMGAVLMIVLVVVAVMFLLSLLRRRPQPAMQYAGVPYGGTAQCAPASAATPVSTGTATTNSSIPPDFPVESFLRSAKTSFIRLQAANDRKDLNDIREYTTPEMFAEISMQIQERDNTPQKTDVDSVQAELLEVATEQDIASASVRLSGQIRENNGAPENFDEIWHVQKNLKDDKSVWLLAGIQQV